MRVTDKTKYKDFASCEEYLTPRAVAQLKSAAEQRYGEMYELSFAQFHACANGDYSEVLGDVRQPTVLQVYWRRRFDEFVSEFVTQLNKLTPPQTQDEKQAAQGLLKIGWDEGLLVFIQSYFGTRSFKEAAQITVGEIMIARRARYNQELFRRKMAAIQTSKLNSGKFKR